MINYINGDLINFYNNYQNPAAIVHCISNDWALGAGIAKQLKAEFKKLINVIVKRYEENKLINDLFEYNMYDMKCEVSVTNPDELITDYYVNVYFDKGGITFSINKDYNYYIHECYERLDGNESLIRDLLINKYGFDEYLKKITGLINV